MRKLHSTNIQAIPTFLKLFLLSGSNFILYGSYDLVRGQFLSTNGNNFRLKVVLNLLVSQYGNCFLYDFSISI